MDLPAHLFNWLVKVNVMQESYVASRSGGGAVTAAMSGTLKRSTTTNLNATHAGAKPSKPSVVTLTQQAANAVFSGHAFYYLCYNICFAQGYQFTQTTLVGNPGDEVSSQVCFYNWQILSDIFGILGLGLSSELRDLIVAGDTKIIVEMLRDLYLKYSGEASDEQRTKRWASPSPIPPAEASALTNTSLTTPLRPSKAGGGGYAGGPILTPIPRREGAASVDSGLRKLADAKAEKQRQQPDPGVEASKQKFLQRLEKEREAQRKAEEAARRAEDLRLRMTSNIDYSKFRTVAFLPESEKLSKYPVFMEFQNRGAVGYCLQIIEDIVDRIESGDAQAELAEKEAAKRAARRAARDRKRRGERLIDVRNPIHLPPEANHKVGMFIATMVRKEIVDLALRDDVHAVLDQRAEVRRQERECLSAMFTRLERSVAKVKRNPKHDEAIAERKKRELEERKEQEQKMERLRALNRDEALVVQERSKLQQSEKKLQEAVEQEKAKRRDAEMTLYLAEQKAKVIERRRERELQIAADAERKKQAEEEARQERRRIGIELNKKLQLKEQQRLAAIGKNATGVPATLTAFNQGTGDHAAYFGDTLGWQYLSEAEFDLAQMICQCRSDPPSLVPCLEQLLSTLNGRTLVFTDERGKRHPCVLGEGRPAILEAIEFLNRAKTMKPIDDISIGLTLAARQHAIDLCYHGNATANCHTGSDGSTLTQRLLRYGAHAIRSGAVEMVTCVVRPAVLRQGPVDILSRLLVSDNDPARTARNAVFTGELFESVGVGHAMAEFEGLIVEAFVVIMSYGFIDKPVAAMAAAQHNGIKAVAAPFIDGIRRVHESMADRRRLMSSANVVIGNKVEANPDFDALHRESLKRRKHVPPLEHTGHTRRQQTPPSATSSPTKAEEEEEQPPAKPRTAAEEAEHQKRKRRVTRFYDKYAPAKKHVVDDALVVFQERFDDLINLLVRKYGPEPPGTPPPPADQSKQRQDDSGDKLAARPAAAESKQQKATTPTKAAADEPAQQTTSGAAPRTPEAKASSSGSQPAAAPAAEPAQQASKPATADPQRQASPAAAPAPGAKSERSPSAQQQDSRRTPSGDRREASQERRRTPSANPA